MHIVEDLNTLSTGDIEEIEKLTIRWAFQAVVQFGSAPYEIFRDSSDEAQDIAEDVNRELLDMLAGYNIPQRLLGNVDYRRALYYSPQSGGATGFIHRLKSRSQQFKRHDANVTTFPSGEATA